VKAVLKDSFSIDEIHKVVRMYDDGSIWIENFEGTNRVQVHPWVQGEMGRIIHVRKQS
jgi:hypothetical protein